MNNTNESCNLEFPEPGLASKITSGFILAAAWVLILASLFLYYRERKTKTYLQHRNFALIAMSGVGNLLFSVVLIRGIIGGTKFPCALIYLGPIAVFTFIFIPLVIRVLSFHFKLARNKFLADQLHIKAMQRNTEKEDFASGKDPSFTVYSETTEEASSQEFVPSHLSIFSKADVSEQLEYLSFLASTKFSFILIGISFFFASVVFGLRVRVEGTFTCVGCNLQNRRSIARVFIVLLPVVLFSLYVSQLVKNEPDNFWIRKEIRFALVINYTTVLIWSFLVGTDPGNFAEEERVQPAVILMIGFLLSFLYMTLYQAFVVDKKQKETEFGNVLGSSLKDILQNKTCRKLFKAHLVEELAFENYLFYSAITSWKEEYKNLAFEYHEKFYEQILASFILPGSPLEINISYFQRKTIIENIKRKEYNIDDFDEAYSEVEKLLVQDSLPRFKFSSRYQNWIKNDNIGRMSAFL
eukprot:snap_masked-scaffold_14-processed-gene-5.14-mRNA-1 protein AED:1.00 eAED:1.00 QI:0/0/0/0/1/1/2/0/467